MLTIRIAATSAAVSAEGKLSWRVDIFVGDRPLHRDLALQDPLDKKGRTLCRWYFDKYQQREPYSSSKAKSAAALLGVYGSRLCEQIELDSVADEVTRVEYVTVVVEDCFTVPTDASHSIQQLYWEFLENESPWIGHSTTVRVQRGAKLNVRQADGSLSHLPETVNILLVTARNLRREWTSDADISPFLVSDILWDVQSRFRRLRSRTKLNIEMVRPGTFEALKHHLEQKRTRGGDGDIGFHTVHFDMHGAVEEYIDKGGATRKRGVLYFNDPDPENEETTAVPAEEVACLLAEHSIPLVVMNACDSARAGPLGNESNTAQTLVEIGGVGHVLGVTHRVSQSAVAVFVEAFYMALLTQGRTFQDAVVTARQKLRSQPLRNARFHLVLPLIDWALPVVYSSEPTLDARIISLSGDSLEEEHVQDEPMSPTQQQEDGAGLLGREFDLLRLEKTLLQPEGIAYVQGSPGVGKSAFLRHLARLWMRSSFVDHAFYIEFSATSPTPSRVALLEELFRQAKLDIQRKQHGMKSDSSAFASATTFFEYLSRRRAVFILDGLFDLRPNKPHTLREAKDLLLFLNEVRGQSQHTEEALFGSKYILVSGRSDKTWPDLDTLRFPTYRLQGLQKPDSIALTQRIIGASNTTVVQQGKEAEEDLSQIWKIEPLIHLLQGNPAALLHLSKLARDADMPLSELYEILHSEDAALRLDVNTLWDSFPLFSEFVSIINTLPDDWLTVWLILAWYWHIGIAEKDFAKMLVDSGVLKDEACVRPALHEATRWGYVERAANAKQPMALHPLFTIFVRLYACSSACRVTPSMSKPQLDAAFVSWGAFRRHFTIDTANCLVAADASLSTLELMSESGRLHGLEYAIWLLRCLLGAQAFRDQDWRFYGFRNYFFLAASKDCDRVGDAVVIKGPGYDDWQADQSSVIENHLFIAKLCRGRGALPLPPRSWPIDILGHIAYILLDLCSSQRAAAVAGSFEELLHRGIALSKMQQLSDVVDPIDLPSILRVAALVAEIHRSHIPSTEKGSKAKEYLEMARDILAASEQRFGATTDPQVLYNKAILSYQSGLALAEDRKVDESRAEFRNAIDLFREMRTTANPMFVEMSQRRLDQADEDEAAMWARYYDEIPRNMDQFEDVCNLVVAEAMGINLQETEEVRSYRKRRRNGGIRQAGVPQNELFEKMFRNSGRLLTTTHKLNVYETDLDRGHWGRAIGAQGAMAVQSMTRWDFDEMREHLRAQEEIAERHGVVEENKQNLDGVRHSLDMFEKLVNAARETVRSTSSDDDKQNGTDTTSGKQWEVMMEWLASDSFQSNPLSASAKDALTDMVRMLRERAARDREGNLPHLSAPGVLFTQRIGQDDPGSGNDSSVWEEAMQGMMQKHIFHAVRSTDQGETYLFASIEASRAVFALEDAEDASDETVVYSLLDKLAQLAERKPHSSFIDKKGVAERRDWNTSRLLHDLSEPFNAITPLLLDIDRCTPEEMDTARATADRCRRILALHGPDTKTLVPERPPEGQDVSDGRYAAARAMAQHGFLPAIDAMSAELHLHAMLRRMRDGAPTAPPSNGPQPLAFGMQVNPGSAEYHRLGSEVLAAYKAGAFDAILRRGNEGLVAARDALAAAKIPLVGGMDINTIDIGKSNNINRERLFNALVVWLLSRVMAAIDAGQMREAARVFKEFRGEKEIWDYTQTQGQHGQLLTMLESVFSMESLFV